MLVINPGIQKNKGKVKKGLRQTELHSMSLWLLLRGAVHPESSPAGRNGKAITDGQNPVCSYSAVDMTLNMVSCSRPSTAFSCSVLQLCFSRLSASTWLLTYPLSQAQTLSTFLPAPASKSQSAIQIGLILLGQAQVPPPPRRHDGPFQPAEVSFS